MAKGDVALMGAAAVAMGFSTSFVCFKNQTTQKKGRAENSSNESGEKRRPNTFFFDWRKRRRDDDRTIN